MSRFVEVPGGRIFAVEEGQGPPIVLIHAAIVDRRSWDAVAPLLVDRGYRVVRYDMRGFGRTETEDVEYSPRADLIAVMDAFGIERAAVVGNSRGGQTALEAAVEYPERFAAVMTIGSGPNGFDGGETPEEQALSEEYDRLDAQNPRDVEALVEMTTSIWADGPGQPPTRFPAELRPYVIENVRKEFEPGYVEGKLTHIEPAANDRLGELRCPVVALVGALDLSGLVKAAQRIGEAAPNARTVIWPDAAHLPGMEHPQRLADLIVELVGPVAPWS